MQVYKVEVQGYFRESLPTVVRSATLTFLVMASTCDEAFKAASSIAETVAMVGPKWEGFETLSASPIAFPYMLSDTTMSASKRGSEARS